MFHASDFFDAAFANVAVLFKRLHIFMHFAAKCAALFILRYVYSIPWEHHRVKICVAVPFTDFANVRRYRNDQRPVYKRYVCFVYVSMHPHIALSAFGGQAKAALGGPDKPLPKAPKQKTRIRVWTTLIRAIKYDEYLPVLASGAGNGV